MLRHFIVTLTLGVSIIGLFGTSADALDGPSPHIFNSTLPSGQEVFIQENHSQPIVTIDTWVNTGSSQEVTENNGVSHFLEHLLFKGTTTYGVGEIDRILESRGANFNAATSKDFTHYVITTASPYFKEALDIHADMLLNATINPDPLTRERKVVQEEINRAMDNPSRKLFLKLSELLYTTHPYALDTLGPKSNIATISRQAILDYYHQWYQPKHFKTVIVGDINTQTALQDVEDSFQKAYHQTSRPTPATRSHETMPAVTQPLTAVLEDPNVSDVKLMLGFQAPPITKRQDNFALDVAALVLGQGRSSRLHQRLTEQEQLFQSVSMGNYTQQQSGLLYVSGETTVENRTQALQAMLEELTRVKQEGIDHSELEKAKTQVIKDFAFLTESTKGVASTLGYNVTIGELSDYTDYVSNIQKITPQQVQQALNTYLDFNKAVLVEMVPASAKLDSHQLSKNSLALLTTMANKHPTSLASHDGSGQPSVQKHTLSNGITLLMKPSSMTQTVSINVFAKGGRLLEEKPGVAVLTSRLLLKETAHRSNQEINDFLEQRGLQLNTSAQDDYLEMTGSALATELSDLLLIMQDVMSYPTFPESELDKERTFLLQQLKVRREKPSGLVFEKLMEGLYPTHPYGAVGDRLEQSLPTITRQDVEHYYRQQFQPQHMVISVVGNFDPSQLTETMEQITSRPPTPVGTTQDSLPSVSPLASPLTLKTHKPKQAATWIAYGWHGPQVSSTQDYVALKVINAFLGEGMSSRLFVNLREKEGLAYVVGSQFPSRLQNSQFVMYIGTAPQNESKVLQAFDKEIKFLQSTPLATDELEWVKSKLVGSFALSHETNASQAFYLSFYETLGVGHEFDIHYPELVQQVTPADVQRVANIYLKSPKVISIVAPQAVEQETP